MKSQVTLTKPVMTAMDPYKIISLDMNNQFKSFPISVRVTEWAKKICQIVFRPILILQCSLLEIFKTLDQILVIYLIVSINYILYNSCSVIRHDGL